MDILPAFRNLKYPCIFRTDDEGYAMLKDMHCIKMYIWDTRAIIPPNFSKLCKGTKKKRTEKNSTKEREGSFKNWVDSTYSEESGGAKGGKGGATEAVKGGDAEGGKGCDNLSEGDEGNVVMVDEEMKGQAVKVEQLERNLLHTDLVDVLWESMNVMSNRIHDIEE